MKATPVLSVMRGRVPRRLSTYLLAVTLLLGAGRDVVGQHACPHHGGSEPSGAVPGQADVVVHTAHHGHHTGNEPPATGPHDGHDAPCACNNGCPASAPLPNLGFAVTADTLPLLEPVRSSPIGESYVARVLLRLLPFPNGPPVFA